MTPRAWRGLSRRKQGTRRYRSTFFIATEGLLSEPQYFEMLDSHHATVRVKCLKRTTASAPEHVLRDMRKWLAKERLQENDQAWIVVDADSWPEDQLLELHRWTVEDPRYHLAVSNPCFELWLLLHFEDGNGAVTTTECLRRLKRHASGYDKRVRPRDFPLAAITDATERARERDVPPCDDWPRAAPGTTVYRLVEEIQEAAAAE